jgi:hypothetical protein
LFTNLQCSPIIIAINGTEKPADGRDPYAKRCDNVWSADGRVVPQGTFVFTLPPRIEGRRIAWRLVVKYARLTDVFRLDVDDASALSSAN